MLGHSCGIAVPAVLILLGAIALNLMTLKPDTQEKVIEKADKVFHL
jgi:hypothetical protein